MFFAIDCVRWMLHGLPILLVKLPDFDKFAMISAIACDELRGHSDRLCAVNLEVRAWTKEVVCAQPVRLDVTTVLVAHATESIFTIVTTISALAAGLLSGRATMHGVC